MVSLSVALGYVHRNGMNPSLSISKFFKIRARLNYLKKNTHLQHFLSGMLLA